ncbi:LytR C-terminal domain-containing protein [Trujillonella humicola]|uniref:LytR C-terminal domain-containing protein n=1 Tax=Trujillonella humicola TaxID=3383699 RepID=UPI00390586A2
MNRRRTDAPAAAPAELPEDPGDHPTTPGRSRADRRRDGLLDAGIDPGRRPARAARPGAPEPGRAPGAPARPPAVARPAAASSPRQRPSEAPAPSRPPAGRPAVAAPAVAAAQAARPVAGPSTTVAPFRAVPSPGPTEHPSAPLPDVPGAGWDRGWLDEPSVAPEVPPTVVPAAEPAAEPAAPSRRAPSAPVPSQGNPAYRDWTRPSGQGAAPATTAIPDRDAGRGRRDAPVADAVPGTVVPDAVPGTVVPDVPPAGADGGVAEQPRDRVRDDAGGAHTGVVGGRAALREERRAAEDERRREARRHGVAHVRARVPGTEDDEPRPARRRGVAALLAVVVVALVVLGVYSFASPQTQPASDGEQQAAPSAPAPVQTSGALPPLEAEPLSTVADAPGTPVRVGVTVLNATNVNGLAADIAGVLAGDGWETVATGAYDGDDVGVTTVYYTEGVDEQRWSAEQLHELHPEVKVVAVRFFEVPGETDPGLVVVAAGDWRP